MNPNSTTSDNSPRPFRVKRTVATMLPRPDETGWVPFPTRVLPSPLGEFVDEAARAIGCDPSCVALPVLAACAQAIGNSRRIRLKRTWMEPAIIWAVVVGRSGTHKSPAFDIALRPLRRRESVALGKWEVASRDYRVSKEKYEEEVAGWRQNPQGDRPTRPAEPKPERYLVGDITVEALVETLKANPRGLLVARNELVGWFASFYRHSGQRGGELAHWLEMHEGRPLTIDRKTGQPKMIFVPRASVSVTGGMTPGVLKACLGVEQFENGLVPRLLLAYPPSKDQRWTEDDMAPATEEEMDHLFDQLLALDFEVGQPSRDQPELGSLVLPLRPEAKEIFVKFYNRQRAAMAEAGDHLAAALSKLEAYAARFALIFQLVTDSGSREVDEANMQRGIDVVRWFSQETGRIYSVLEGESSIAVENDLLELIRRRGGRITARNLQRSSRRYPTAESARVALQQLEDLGLGLWINGGGGPAGGRPSAIFEIRKVGGEPVPRRPASATGDDETSQGDPKNGDSSTSTVSTPGAT